MKTLQELLQERSALIDTIKALIEEGDKREERGLTDDENTRVDGWMESVDTLDKEIQQRERLDTMMVATNDKAQQRQQRRPGQRDRSESREGAPAFINPPGGHKTKDDPDSLYCRFLRSRGHDYGVKQELEAAVLEQYRGTPAGGDVDGYLGAEQRASNDSIMNVATAADGGNLVPTGHYNRIIARKDEAGLASRLPIMPIPGVGTTVNVPVDNEADSEFVLTSEQVDAGTNLFDRDSPATDKKAMTLLKYSKVIELTDELLFDNDSNLMQWLEFRVGLGLRKTDNNLIVTEALANGTAALTFDSATAIAAAEIPELVYLQADGYDDDNFWVMTKAVLGEIRALSGNDFLFAATPQGQVSGDLWGFPVATTGKMNATAAGNKSLILGDFNFMGVRRMPGLTTLVNPYRKQGLLLLEYYYRVDFAVLQAAAIIYGTHPTA